MAILATSNSTQTAALLIAAALYGPVFIIEGIGAIINLAIRLGRLMLNHRRKQLVVGDQEVLILTS